MNRTLTKSRKKYNQKPILTEKYLKNTKDLYVAKKNRKS